MTSSDEDINILTTCFCFIFISSGCGCSGFTYIEIDRSINRSVVLIAPYALTTNSDLELFSPVTPSDEDISIFRGYYCTYQLAERPVCKVYFAKSPANAPAERQKLFQNKNTSAQSALGDTGFLTQFYKTHAIFYCIANSSEHSRVVVGFKGLFLETRFGTKFLQGFHFCDIHFFNFQNGTRKIHT